MGCLYIAMQMPSFKIIQYIAWAAVAARVLITAGLLFFPYNASNPLRFVGAVATYLLCLLFGVMLAVPAFLRLF